MPDATADYMLVTTLVPRLHELSAKLLRAGVDSKHHYMRDCAAIFEAADEFPNAARAEEEILHLPAYPELSSAQIDTVAEKMLAAVSSLAAPRAAEAAV